MRASVVHRVTYEDEGGGWVLTCVCGWIKYVHTIRLVGREQAQHERR